MRFSIITVTRNNLAGLKWTQISLAAQTSRDFEWIIIDGASDDGTKEFLQKTTVQWISEPDAGIYDAMNKGMKRATGDHLLFLNAGDELAAPDVLEKLSTIDADFIYGDALENHMPKPARPHTKIARGLFTHHQAMFYRRALIGDLRYDTTYKIAADYKFTLQFLKKARRVSYWPHPVCIFKQGGVSQKNAVQGRREQFNIRRNQNESGVFSNSLIFLCQSAALSLRRHLPGLYWGIRKRI